MRSRALCVVLASIFLLSAEGPAAGQQIIDRDERIGFDTPDAWAMKYVGSLSLLTGFGAPRAMEPGEIHVAFEGGSVPSLDEEERRVGLGGRKVEEINRTPVFGRLRVEIGLPAALSLTLAYVPPLEVEGVEADLFAVALGRPVWTRGSTRLGLRLYGQVGEVSGDLTCSQADLDGDGGAPEIGIFCEELSTDEMDVRYAGLELAGTFRDGSRWRPHAGVALNYFDTEVQVDAFYSGFHDLSHLTTDGYTVSVTAGLSFQPAERWRLTGELFYTPLDIVRLGATESVNQDLFNARGMIVYRLR